MVSFSCEVSSQSAPNCSLLARNRGADRSPCSRTAATSSPRRSSIRTVTNVGEPPSPALIAWSTFVERNTNHILYVSVNAPSTVVGKGTLRFWPWCCTPLFCPFYRAYHGRTPPVPSLIVPHHIVMHLRSSKIPRPPLPAAATRQRVKCEEKRDDR